MALAGLPSFGARRSFERAMAAASAGNLDEAAADLRAYFAERYRGRGPMKGADAEAAMLAATCAILRGDFAELEGVASLVEYGQHKTTIAAFNWIQLLRAAVAGDVAKVFQEQDALAAPALRPLLPAVLLIASERGLAKMSSSDADLLRRAFSDGQGSPEVVARVAVVLAAIALRDGNRAAAVAELAKVGPAAPPLHRFVAAIASGQLQEAEALASAMPAEDRTAASSFVARLAVGADSASIERYLDIVGPFAPAAQRSALVAALGTALAREGSSGRALQVLEVERQRSPGSGALAMATAFSALAGGNAALASDALRKLPAGEIGAIALKLVALAAKGDHEALARELDAAEALSDKVKGDIQSVVLAALVKGGAVLPEARTPYWLAARPSDPEGLYAWGVLRLRQSAPADALAAFDEALAKKPALAQMGDSPDAARVAVARSLLVAGDAAGADRLARAVTSAKQAAFARRLRALALLQRLGRERGVAIDASSFANVVQTLLDQLPQGSEEHALLGLLTAEAKRMRVRSLLVAGRTREARPILDEQIRASWDSDAAYLGAVAALLEGTAPEELESYLASTTDRDPGNHKNHVLLSEVRGTLRGAEAKLATLEPLRAEAAASALLQEALASAYGGARRGLEAKKVGFAELRRLGANVPAALAAQIREALALEAPPLNRGDVRDGSIARAAKASLLPRDQISSRIDVLVARASQVRDSSVRAAMDPVLSRLKQGVLAGELEAAHAAELELVELIGRAGA